MAHVILTKSNNSQTMALPIQIIFITERERNAILFHYKNVLTRPQIWNNLLHENKITQNKS